MVKKHYFNDCKNVISQHNHDDGHYELDVYSTLNIKPNKYMLPKTISQGEHFEILQITNNAIKVTFRGFLKVNDLKALSTFMNTFTKDNQIELLMVDQSGLKVLSKEVQAQLAKTISIVNKGLKRIAIIEAEDIFAKVGFDKLRREAEQDEVKREVFQSDKAALVWLLS